MDCFQQWKQVLSMAATTFSMAATTFSMARVNILLKKVLNEGTNLSLIILYRQMMATILLTLIAYFWERKSRPKLTMPILYHHFLSALIGVTPAQYLLILGLKYTSATFTCAFINMVPVNTFILALLFRLEKVSVKITSGRAKVLGALVCVGGALVLTLYKGIPLRNLPTLTMVQNTNQMNGTNSWGIDTILLTAGSIMWSSWFLIQAKIGKIYLCQYSSTAMISFFSSLQSTILCMVLDRNISAWIIEGKLQIPTVLYAGTLGSGLCYVVMSWCVKERGPVFTSSFSPFIQIFVAAFDITFLREQIHLGSVLGSILVIVGMYILLWGKLNEAEPCKTTKPGLTSVQNKDNDDQVSYAVPAIPLVEIVPSKNTPSRV